VLIQLPFQPVMIHQWAVALLAEALRFQKELSDFYCIGFPTSLTSAVAALLKMCDTMLSTAMNFLACFNFCIQNASLNMHKIIEPIFGKMDESLQEILPILEFVLSDECRNIVKALKKIAFNQSTKIDYSRRPEVGVADFGDHQTIYNYEFWHQNKFISQLFAFDENLAPWSADLSATFANKESTDVNNECDTKAKKRFEKLVTEKIIEAGKLKGNKREIFEVARQCEDSLMPYVKTYFTYFREYNQ